MGIQYKSLLQDLKFNDSESLLWDFALYMEGKIDKIEASGAIAFIAVKLVDGELTNLYFGRNTNPLHMDNTDKGLFLSSEGKGPMIDADTLYDYKYADNMYSMKDLVLGGRRVSNYQSAMPYRDSSWEDDYGDSYGYWEKGRYIPYRSVCNPGQSVRQAITSGGPGGWLSESLKEKYDIEKIVEYVDDGNGEMVEMTTTRMVPKSTPLLDFPTLKSAGENMVMQYLIRNKGKFEDAYTELERDYELTYDGMEQSEVERMEKALGLIAGNPEWINPDSVSSVWRALCKATINEA
jgi:hypothetical protein